MATTQTRNALSILLIVLALFAQAQTVTAIDLAAEPPSCTGTANGGASCGYQCPAGAKLLISASTSDQDWNIPEVWGHNACGGIQANCPETTGACSGDSGNQRTGASGTAACNGYTDEPSWSEDPMTVTCSAAVDGGASTLRMSFEGPYLRSVSITVADGSIGVTRVYAFVEGVLELRSVFETALAAEGS